MGKPILILLILYARACSAQLEKIEYGKFPVSFLSLTRFDTSRSAVAEQKQKHMGRILQINIWFPLKSAGEPMHFGNYVELAALETDSTISPQTLQKGIDKYFAWPASLKSDKKLFEKFIGQRKTMRANRAKQFRAGDYPLIMLIHGFAADHAYLAEYLCSFGYVVMQVPVKGSTTYELDYEGKGLENQVLDHEFAWNVLQHEFGYSADRVAVAGFSFGGQSAVALALQHPKISCVVSLDGGIGSVFGAQLLNNYLPDQDNLADKHILHLYNARDQYTQLDWFNRMDDSRKILLPMKNMEHGHFTSFGVLNADIPALMGTAAADPGDGYASVMILTQKFITSVLNNPSTLKDFVKITTSVHPWIKENFQ